MNSPMLSGSLSGGADRLGSRVPAEVPNVSVIVPTYCEAANLPVLVPRIQQAICSAGLTGEIIVVDDNSPDRTREVCEALSAEYPLRLKVRYDERGLSSAVVEGMRLASGD